MNEINLKCQGSFQIPCLELSQKLGLITGTRIKHVKYENEYLIVEWESNLPVNSEGGGNNDDTSCV